MINMEKFFSTRGQFVSAEWVSEKKPAAKHKGVKLEKHCSGVFRAGINFSNLGYVIDGIRDGERGEVQPLPWGQWKQFPYVIEHKGSDYIRLYPPAKTLTQEDGTTKRVSDWSAARMTVEYKVDGKTVDKATFLSYLTPSDAKSDDNPPECITVKAENLLRLCESE